MQIEILNHKNFNNIDFEFATVIDYQLLQEFEFELLLEPVETFMDGTTYEEIAVKGLNLNLVTLIAICRNRTSLPSHLTPPLSDRIFRRKRRP